MRGGRPMKLITRPSILGVAALALTSCATAPAPTTPTVHVTGDWQGRFKCDRADAGSAGIVVLSLTQTGSAVKGHATVTNAAVNRTGNYEGTVSDDQFRIVAADFSVDTKVTGDQMAGTFKSGICTGTVALGREPFQGTAHRSRLTA